MGEHSGSTTAHRTRLHHRYAALSNLPDASRLAYLRGPEQTWTLDEVAELWRSAPTKTTEGLAPLNNLYLHVPFCKSICSFCNYERLRPSSPQYLKTWQNRLFHTIERLAPSVSNMEFHTLYIGGGTPSVLPAGQLDEVLARLHTAFNWHTNAARHFEFDPAIMNEPKLDVLVRHGVTHFSFGIQTLQAAVNAAHNRGPQSLSTVAKCFNAFRTRDIHQVSCDFLAGLEGTTPDQLLHDVEEVVSSFQPAWVDVFMITPTKEYVEKHFSGSYDTFYEHLGPFEQTVPKGLDRIAKMNGYHFLPGQGHHLCLQRMEQSGPRGTRDAAVFSYTQLVSEAKRPINLMGLGPSARSHIFGVATFQNWDPSPDPADQRPPYYKGHPQPLASEAVTYLSHDLRDTNTIDRAHFNDLFGADITEVLPEAIQGWTEHGHGTIDDTRVSLTPQSRQERTRTLLWMVDAAHLEYDIARHMALDLSPKGLAELLAPLPLETRLADGVVFESVTHAHLTLRLSTGERHKVRVCPPLDNGKPPSLILLRAPKQDRDKAHILRAIQQLQRLIRKNYRPWVPDHS